MSSTTYKPDLRDIEFVLFDHLRIADTLLQRGKFKDVAGDDVRMVLNAASDFASEVMAPANAAGDVEGCTRGEDGVKVPKAFEPVWREVTQQGWIGLMAPADLGGQGLPHVLATAVDEMMVGANPAFHTFLGLCRASANLLLRHGSDALKALYVPKLLTGEWQGTMCLTEPGAGSDVGASVTRATPKGDGTYSIQGTKVFITAGEHQLTANHVHLVLARLPNAPAGVKGLSLFLVPRFRPDANGKPAGANDVVCSKIEEKMGIHGSCTTVMNFGESGACTGWLVGNENQGIQCMFQMMNEERIVVGLQGQALAAAMFTNARRYAGERVQGSDIAQGKSITEEKVTIDDHPDVRRMLMTVRALAEGGRALLYYTSAQQDLVEVAEDETSRARHEALNALLTPVCKAWGSDSGVEACSVALQVYGGSGYCRDYPAEQALRDARIAPIYEGTNGIQAIDLLMRKVLGGGGKLMEPLLAELDGFVKAEGAHPALSRETGELGKAIAELRETTAFLGKSARADVRLTALGASPYLTLFGNVVVAWLLLAQAALAHERSSAIAIPADASARREFLKENESAAFLAGKVETARFFVHQILSQNRWKAAQILSGDRSALDVCL